MLLVFSLQERRAPSIAQHMGWKATKGVSGRGRRCCQDWPPRPYSWRGKRSWAVPGDARVLRSEMGVTMQITGRYPALLAVLGCLAFAAGGGATEKAVPTSLAQARFVAFGFDLGDRFVGEQLAFGDDRRIIPEDRRALAALRTLFEEWGHYTLTDRPQHSELLVVVRLGQRAVGNVGVHGGGPAGEPSGANPFVGAALASTGDMLSVYESDGAGRPAALLWREIQDGGLSGSPPPLFEALKRDVERAARRLPSGPQVSLDVGSANGHPVVGVGETAVASIGFHGTGWGDQPVRWDLRVQGQRVSYASVPIPGATISGRQIEVQWPLTDEDCARIVRAAESDPQSGSPDLASVTVRVRRASDEKALQSFAAALPVDCSP